MAAVAVCAGCSFDQRGVAFEDGGGGSADARVVIDGVAVEDAFLPDAPVNPADATVSDAALIDAALPDAGQVDAQAVLADTGLIVRYFINEASSGQTPTALIDSAPNPLNLDITYTGQMQFTETGGHRGLAWTTSADDARADVAVMGTKIRNQLNGSQTSTIEVVIDVNAVTSLSSRIVHIGNAMESGECSLTSTNDARLTVRGSNADIGTFPVDLPGSGRIVVHAVVDTTLNTAGDRTRLYVDGVEVPNTGGINPIQNDTYSIGASSSFVIGNRAIGGRSVEGTIYYAALYSAALTPAEVANNAAILAVSDD